MRVRDLSPTPPPSLTLSDRAALLLAIGILLLTTAAAATILLTPAYGLPLGVATSEGTSMGHDSPQVVVYADTGEISTGDRIVFDGAHAGYLHHRVVSETEHGYVTQGDAERFIDQTAANGSPPVPYATQGNTRGVTVATTSLQAVQGGVLALLALLGLMSSALYRRRISDTLHRARSSLPELLPRTRQLAAVLFGVLLVVSLIGPGVILLPGVEYDHSGTAAASHESNTLEGFENGDPTPGDTLLNDSTDYAKHGSYSGKHSGDGFTEWTVDGARPSETGVYFYKPTSESYGGKNGVLFKNDSSTWGPNAFVENGNVYAYVSGNSFTDTGLDVPKGEWIHFRFYNLDYGTGDYSIEAFYANGTSIGKAGPYTSYGGAYDDLVLLRTETIATNDVFYVDTFSDTQGVQISGTVNDSAGNPVSGATVDANDPDISSTTTDSNGKYTLTAPSGGTYDITATYDGDSTTETYDVPSSGLTGADLQFTQEAFGEVTDSDGNPLDASVTVEQDGVQVNSTTTNNSGNYRVGGLSDGSYTLVADADGYVTETKSITVSGADVSENFTLGGNFGGQVVKRDGSPCSDCMVELWMVNDANTSTDPGETVKEAQQDLVDNVSRAVPRDLYQPDQSVVDDVLHGGQDSEAVLLHSPDAWKEEAAGWNIPLTDYRYSVYSKGNSLEVPTNQVEPGKTYIASCWEPKDGGIGGRVENSIDNSIDPGRTTGCNITVEQIGPGNATVNRKSLETEEGAFTSTAGFVTTKEHHAVEVTLPEGYWRLSSTESGAATIIRAGNPEDLPRTIEHNLTEYDGTAADIAQDIQQKIDAGQFDRVTVSTDANGRFSHPVPDGYSTVAVTAFSGQGLLEAYQSPTVADLRAEVERDDYQRSIYLSQKPVTTHPPDTNVTVTVREVTNPTFEDIDSYLGRLQWFNELIDTEHYTDTEGYFTDSPGSVGDGEIRDRVGQLAGIIEQQQDLLDSARDSDTNYDDTARNVEDSSTRELKEALEAQEKALQEQTSTINNLRDTVTELQEQESGSTLLSMDIPFKSNDLDAEATAVIVQWDNGSSTTMPEQYWSVSSGSTSDVSGSVQHDYVQIEEYPLPSDVAVANIKVITATGDGTSERSERVTNPGFSGDVPTLNAISANTLRPGPSDRVQLEIDPTERSSYQRLTTAEVYAPNGSQLTTGVSGDSVEFNTQGAGRHLVKLTVEDTDGNQYTETLRIKAGAQDAPMPPGVRIREGILGTHALAGDGVDTARVRVDQQSGTAHIGAVFPEEHTERELHVYAGDALTRTAGTYEIRALEGEDEKANGKMEVVLHTSALSEDAHIYRDGSDPITAGDGTAAGRVVHNPDGSRIQTYTGKDGTVSVEYNNAPGWSEGVRWWVLTNVPGATRLPGAQISSGGVLAGVTQTVGSAISGYIPDIGAVQGGFPTLYPWGEML